MNDFAYGHLIDTTFERARETERERESRQSEGGARDCEGVETSERIEGKG